ncbi:unnamed protein product [Vitrella brassicaformis CCMP3155]|uniref:Uncharacterized protein n=1 Tax=Vitrella brassicaformis (strain CCMP3155) TaxID=1169540 RepID=A0A0G4EDI9_VITBC|nr:unnamed protein product [Vitrella brassicaformis CCMP3155]|eukprot:CEL93570.1 unnamed protein product [Vitrella brassicaformis CCMP3155]
MTTAEMLPLPIDSLSERIEAVEHQTRVAVLMLSGALCPVHNGHLEAMEVCRAAVQTIFGVPVAQGYLIPSSEQYVDNKQAKKGEPSLSLADRVRLCEVACQTHRPPAVGSAWLSVCPWGWHSSWALAEELAKVIPQRVDMKGMKLEVWEVAGADFALRCKLWRQPQSLEEQRHRRIVCLERQPATDTIRHEILRQHHHRTVTVTLPSIQQRQQQVTAHLVPFTHGNASASTLAADGGVFVLLCGAGVLMRLGDASSTRVREELGVDGGIGMVRAGWMSMEVVDAMKGMQWRQGWGRNRWSGG